MVKSEAVTRKLTHGEIVANRLAHDRKLMATIDRSMADIKAKRVYSLKGFAEALKSRCRVRGRIAAS